MPISSGLVIGPLACSSSEAAGPSQNSTDWKAAFHTVGALRGPVCSSMPLDVRSPSMPAPRRTSWQELQAILPLRESALIVKQPLAEGGLLYAHRVFHRYRGPLGHVPATHNRYADRHNPKLWRRSRSSSAPRPLGIRVYPQLLEHGGFIPIPMLNNNSSSGDLKKFTPSHIKRAIGWRMACKFTPHRASEPPLDGNP